MSEEEQQQFEELEEDRNGGTEAEDAGNHEEERLNILSVKESVMGAAARVARKLNKEIEEGHETTAFMIAIALAAAKDVVDLVLDLVLIGEIPILGQIPGYFLSAALTYFLWGKGMFKRTKIRIAYYALSLFFDNLPLFNNLPINTLMVIYAWHVVRKRAREAENELGDLKQKTGKELEELEGEEMELEEEYA